MAVINVALSTGHSNKDPGALGIGGIQEFYLNKLLVDEILKQDLGVARWVRIDTICEDMPYPQHLRCTVQQINALPNCMCSIEIHHNASRDNRVSGAQVIFWDYSKKGRALSESINFQLSHIKFNVDFAGLRENWNWHKIYYKTQPLATLKHLKRRLYYLYKTKVPAVIVEPGFITNSADLKFIQVFREQIAYRIKEGVKEWLLQKQK